MPYSNRGHEEFSSTSDYGKDLTSEQKLETLKLLLGENYHPTGMELAAALRREGSPAEGRSPGLENLFSRFGATPAGQAMQAFGDRRLNKEYDQAVRTSLFDTRKVTDEEKQAAIEKYGRDAVEGMSSWVHRTNKLTGDSDVVLARDRDEEGNFWRRYKKPIIQAGAGIVGFALGGPAGAMSAASIAGAARDAYVARNMRRDIRNARRDWDKERRIWERENAPQAGNLFRAAGEGVVEYATKDVRNKKKDQYVRDVTV